MRRFWEDVTEPILRQRKVRRVVEIGSQAGESTRLLLELCATMEAHADVIDPEFPANHAELAPLFERHGRFHQARSLEVLGQLPLADAYLIDGDHNWYTVYHELLAIDDRASQTNGPRPVILMHDVGWPYARRDLYYEANDIPGEQKQESLVGGLLPDRQEAVADGGLNRHLEHARYEGGKRNGVRTAVDDFLAARPDRYRWWSLPVFHGYGFLVPVADIDRPYARFIQSICTENTGLLALAHCVERARVDSQIELESARHKMRAQKERLILMSERERYLKAKLEVLEGKLAKIKGSRGYQMLEELRGVRRRLEQIFS